MPKDNPNEKAMAAVSAVIKGLQDLVDFNPECAIDLLAVSLVGLAEHFLRTPDCDPASSIELRNDGEIAITIHPIKPNVTLN